MFFVCMYIFHVLCTVCVCDISMCSRHSQVVIQDCQKLSYGKGSAGVGQITIIHYVTVLCCVCVCRVFMYSVPYSLLAVCVSVFIG